MKRFVISDLHYDHKNTFAKFKKEDGSPLRPFTEVHEMKQHILDCWNSVVGVDDIVYVVGDVCMKPNYETLSFMQWLNGKKILIKGNHDSGPLDHYTDFFHDIHGALEVNKYILTHIPIHPSCVGRFKGNIHGHLHDTNIMHNLQKDPRYLNVSVEQINYTPIDFMQVDDYFNKIRQDYE